MNNYEFEYTTNQDQYFNYCLWPYIPVSAVENKFRSVNLLFNSFEVAELPNKVFEYPLNKSGKTENRRINKGTKQVV